jgi:hypothetical protein
MTRPLIRCLIFAGEGGGVWELKMIALSLCPHNIASTNVNFHYLKLRYKEAFESKRGHQIAMFEMGSTVVLVFQAPKSFKFTIQPGDKVCCQTYCRNEPHNKNNTSLALKSNAAAVVEILEQLN